MPASGTSKPLNAAVAATTGLLRSLTREEIVLKMVDDLQAKLPPNYNPEATIPIPAGKDGACIMKTVGCTIGSASSDAFIGVGGSYSSSSSS